MSAFTEIEDSDYEQRRHAAELAAWVNSKMRDLEASGMLDEQYFERRGGNIKRLIEEAVPLSRLGLFLWRPGSEPYILCLPAGADDDAYVEVQGFGARSFKVEITTIENDESALRRQVLSQEGTVPLTGPIRRQGKKIIATADMIEVGDKEESTIELALSRLATKVASRTYDRGTAILVYLSQFWLVSPEGRLGLYRRTRQYLEDQQDKITQVFYCHWSDYSIQAVQISRRAGLST